MYVITQNESIVTEAIVMQKRRAPERTFTHVVSCHLVV